MSVKGYMIKNTSNGIIVEWDSGMATGFASRQEAERFIKHICKKTAPGLDFKVSMS